MRGFGIGLERISQCLKIQRENDFNINTLFTKDHYLQSIIHLQNLIKSCI